MVLPKLLVRFKARYCMPLISRRRLSIMQTWSSHMMTATKLDAASPPTQVRPKPKDPCAALMVETLLARAHPAAAQGALR